MNYLILASPMVQLLILLFLLIVHNALVQLNTVRSALSMVLLTSTFHTTLLFIILISSISAFSIRHHTEDFSAEQIYDHGQQLL